MSMQTISSGLFTGNSSETSGHKRSADLTLLSYREVVGLPEMLDISHACAIAQASADLLKAFQSLKFPTFHDTLNK